MFPVEVKSGLETEVVPVIEALKSAVVAVRLLTVYVPDEDNPIGVVA